MDYWKSGVVQVYPKYLVEVPVLVMRVEGDVEFEAETAWTVWALCLPA